MVGAGSSVLPSPIAFQPGTFFYEPDYGTSTVGLQAYQPGVFVGMVQDYGISTTPQTPPQFIPGSFTTTQAGFLLFSIGTDN